MAALKDTSEDISGDFDIVSVSDCTDVRVQVQPNSVASDSDESLTTLTLQEALNKLQELAKENMQLRECLRRSNEQMRAQCTMLESMQASRLKEQASIDQRFDQSRTIMASLRERITSLEHNLHQAELERDESRCKLQALSPSHEFAPSLPFPTGDALQETSESSTEEGVRSREIGDLRDQLSAMLVEVQEARDKIRQLSTDKLLAEQRSLTLENRVRVCEREVDIVVSQREADLITVRRVTELEELVRLKELERLELELRLSRMQDCTSVQHTSQKEVSSAESENAALQDKLQLVEAMNLSLEGALEKRMCELVLLRDDLYRKTTELRECQQKLSDCEAHGMLLKFQAEVYITDFMAERNARERVHEENGAHVERILELEMRVRSLQSEINTAALSGLVSRPHTQASRPPGEVFSSQQDDSDGAAAGGTDANDANLLNDPTDDAGVALFRCPLCLMIFADVTMLQSHFAKCMKQHQSSVN